MLLILMMRFISYYDRGTTPARRLGAGCID